GVDAGERAALLALNSDFHVEYFLGCWWGGTVAVPLNTRWSERELIHSLNDSGAAILFVDDRHLHVASQLISGAPTVKTVVHFGEERTPSGTVSYADWTATAEAPPDGRYGDD